MVQIKPDLETSAKIKVVGVGGSGNNAITRMMANSIQGVDFIAVNTDAQDLHSSDAPSKIHIGKNLTRGLGAGMDPDIGRRAAEENQDEIQEAVKNSDMVFVAYGLGGGTGTGAGPVVADIARSTGALTVAVVTSPFAFEGAQRMRIADEGLNMIKNYVDTLITINNERLIQIIDKDTKVEDAFKIVDDVLRQGVQGISDLIIKPGIINLDFADVKTIMTSAGSALMGIGEASGDDRAITAAKMAINSPLLDLSIDGAKGVLMSVAGGDDITMNEIEESAKLVTDSINRDARVIFGTSMDETVPAGSVKITVIATGFSEFPSILSEDDMDEQEEDVMSSAPAIPSVATQPVSMPQPVAQPSPSFATRQPQPVSRFSSLNNNNNKRPSMAEVAQQQQPKVEQNNTQSEDVDSPDWDIPAFIRRKRV